MQCGPVVIYTLAKPIPRGSNMANTMLVHHTVSLNTGKVSAYPKLNVTTVHGTNCFVAMPGLTYGLCKFSLWITRLMAD